jgi:hypothetical protein
MGDVVYLTSAPIERPASMEEVQGLLDTLQEYGLPGSGLTDREELVLIEALYGLMEKRINEVRAILHPNVEE